MTVINGFQRFKLLKIFFCHGLLFEAKAEFCKIEFGYFVE
jgi:hypothetical protein